MSATIQFAGHEITNEAISQRAYEIWQARGCPEGTSDEDWQTAKEELTAQARSQAETSTQRPTWLRLLDRLRGKAA